MTWLQQVNGWAIAIVFGLVATLIWALIAVVWRSGPPGVPALKRLWGGAQKAPGAAWTAGITLALSLIVAAVSSLALATNHSGPEDSASPAANPTSTTAATQQPTEIVQGGWGPARDLAKHDNRPDTAMLNSVVDDPLVGDERGYMVIRLAGDENAAWSNKVVAVPGEAYEVGIIINNDAKENGQAVEGVRARVEMPGVARTTTAVSQTMLTSTNVTPDEIWAGITLVGQNDAAYAIRYVADSAILHTGGNANGAHLSDELFTEGTLIGCDALDGVLPAGNRCKSWVSFKVQIVQPNFEVGAFVEINGTDVWSTTYAASAGDHVTIRTKYTNTGTTMQNDVVFKVDLPQNMHYVRGTGVLKNPWNESLRLDNEESITKDIGINVGDYAPGETATVTFDVVLDGSPNARAGAQVIEGLLQVTTSGGSKSAPLTFVWF